jgi:hypothetical protein
MQAQEPEIPVNTVARPAVVLRPLAKKAQRVRAQERAMLAPAQGMQPQAPLRRVRVPLQQELREQEPPARKLPMAKLQS